MNIDFDTVRAKATEACYAFKSGAIFGAKNGAKLGFIFGTCIVRDLQKKFPAPRLVDKLSTSHIAKTVISLIICVAMPIFWALKGALIGGTVSAVVSLFGLNINRPQIIYNAPLPSKEGDLKRSKSEGNLAKHALPKEPTVNLDLPKKPDPAKTLT